MDVSFIIQTYGYWAVFIGTCLDHSGIPIFIIAGAVAAQRGLLNPVSVLVCAGSGIFLGDFMFFIIGRKVFQNRPIPKTTSGAFIDRMMTGAEVLYSQNPLYFLLFAKFIPAAGRYLPLVFGVGPRYSARHLVLLGPGNIMYLTLFFGTGYILGDVLFQEQKTITVAIVAGLGILYWIFRKFSNGPRNFKGSTQCRNSWPDNHS